MSRCIVCGSYAINENMHNREKGTDLNLCDVCYWEKRAKKLEHQNEEMLEFMKNIALNFGKINSDDLRFSIINKIEKITGKPIDEVIK